MKLNIRIKNQNAELIPVEAYTIFEVDGHKFFSHYDKTDIYLSDDRWKCSEYFTGLSITYQSFCSEDEAIEEAKIILIKRKSDLDNNIEKAIRQYGYANKEDTIKT